MARITGSKCIITSCTHASLGIRTARSKSQISSALRYASPNWPLAARLPSLYPA